MGRVMKKLLFILLSLFISTSFAANHLSTKDLTLKIKFSWAPDASFYDKPILMHKTLRFHPVLDQNIVLLTQTTLKNNLPVTLVWMVKPTEIQGDVVALQFNLVTYGFHENASVITQPKLILRAGEPGEIKDDMFDLMVTAVSGK